MKPQLRQNPETGKWELYSKELEEADSGCTLIEVKRPLIGFTQEIG